MHPVARGVRQHAVRQEAQGEEDGQITDVIALLFGDLIICR
jgi:hypothetical protein